MNIIIVGAGGVGYHLAKQLSEEKKNISIIEKDLDKVAFAHDNLDCLVIQGEATDLETLKKAGCDKADMFIAVTNSDEVNIVSCFIAAQHFNIPKKVVRLRNIQFSKANFFPLKTMGIDYSINPEIEAAKSIINTVNFGAATDVIIFGIDIQMRGFYIDDKSPFKDKNIFEIKKILNKSFIISGIKRSSGEFIIPSGETKVKEGDYIYIIAKQKIINEIIEYSGKSTIKIKNIAIFGAGNIGIMVAEGLSGKKRNIKIIDKDYEKCKKVSSICKSAIVINGNANDAELFEEENIGNFDVVVTATDSEEINLLSALYAKNIGTKRAIAMLDKYNYIMMANKLDVDAVVSPKLTTVNSILKFIRKGKILGVYSIFSGEAEALELVISESSKLINKTIRDTNLPHGCLIVAVERNNENIIPDGNFVIKENDKMVIFTRKENIPVVEKMI